ncbi:MULTISPECIES: hypothetical protein [unclassified Pseudomonas]|uniref:hypothetical protein n=1 Tax=unclassified Pseudomonas TaxID=196821 RepID=UPI0025EDDEAD|nr:MULTISPECIES: hypothetical protein [unclassified Pseudomonas]
MGNWSDLENSVRQYAQYIWNRPASADRIAGVNFDCVIRISEIELVIIEITKNKSLEKVREDVGKIQTVRMGLMIKNVMVRPFIICDFAPTQGMKDAGKENYIEVISFEDFRKMFFDFPTYNNVRSNRQFGSAVDPTTGEDDKTAYTPVGYMLQDSSEISVFDIAQKLVNGEKIVLLGDYGAGKSRCFKEVFHILAQRVDDTLLYPIAIDLKETWGLESAVEIMRRHFRHLGIGENDTNSVIKAYNGKRLCFLLDGFDEIGSRPWSENKTTLENLRRHALQGVKDLLSKVGAGCLVSGRDHYFNSDQEMFSALGLAAEKTLVARCKDEFSFEEFTKYLAINEVGVSLPDWLPKKPLVLKTIASLSNDQLAYLFQSSSGDEIGFWYEFIDAMCKRDSKIHAILDPDTVKKVLIRLASLTRTKSQNFGPLTENEVVKAFHEITGTYPNEQSTVMLQRLPGLGRVSAETSDRNFVDTFILDGLRALDLSDKIHGADPKISDLKWINPLQYLGSSILGYDIKKGKSAGAFINYVKNAIHREKANKISISDCISALSKSDIDALDFQGVVFNEPHFGDLGFENDNIRNIEFVDGIFESIKLGKTTPAGVVIRDCHIESIFGISSNTGVPNWIQKCNIKNFELIDTLTAIKNSGLTKAQTILVSILIKVYRQAGNGRLEHTLTKGLTHVDKKSLVQVLRYMVSNGYLDTSKDKGETIYKPVRKHQGKIEKILVELDRSDDEIWSYVSQIPDSY